MIDYLREENGVLRAGFRGKRRKLSEDDRCRLAGASTIKCCYAAAGGGAGAEETGFARPSEQESLDPQPVPSIYSSARTELD